ncbi:MAG TPA: glycine cleavage system aminomethyltransferase GcvT [Acidimicrobiales bacterium]|nr:glycine cleavage system aminomethyltransferase GcvT [Acidimicrobiales bacterium]
MLKHSPLDAHHRALGAKLVPFGGWDMPLQYETGTLAEHRACRSDAVVFDVSHLGTVRVRGVGAFDMLQATFTNDLGKIAPGRAQYTHLLDARNASVIDDIIVWWIDESTFDVMPNASNTDRVTGALAEVHADGVEIDDVTGSRAIVAIQGPRAREKLRRVSAAAAEIGRFRVGTVRWHDVAVTVAGTGYTGEDGVECAVPVSIAGAFWDAVLAAGVLPAGLGARDTLRLEAGLPLHGHELGDGITTLEANLGWVVSWTKGPFRGRDALERQRTGGVARVLRGLLLDGRRPPRSGQSVRREDEEVGVITSGNFSPMLEQGIALAFLLPDVAVGEALTIDVRGTLIPATVVDPPFYRR